MLNGENADKRRRTYGRTAENRGATPRARAYKEEKKKLSGFALQSYISAGAALAVILLSLSESANSEKILGELKKRVSEQYPPEQALDYGKRTLERIAALAQGGAQKSKEKNEPTQFIPDDGVGAERLNAATNWEDSGKNPPTKAQSP